MKRNIYLYLLFILFSSTSPCLFSQVDDEKIRLDVLEKNNIGKTFVYGSWNEKGGDETHLTYLGIVTNGNIAYKLMTSCWIWGHSKRATNRILIYDSNNKYLGNYYLTMRCDLPKKIKNNMLIFDRSQCEDCDDIQSAVDFSNGIPESFFINCIKNSGDVYSFDKN